jgi:hypothetical protein
VGPERIHLSLYGALAETVDLAHALSMLVWGLGLPVLAWHHVPRLSRAYTWFAIAFVLISVVSHYVTYGSVEVRDISSVLDALRARGLTLGCTGVYGFSYGGAVELWRLSSAPAIRASAR